MHVIPMIKIIVDEQYGLVYTCGWDARMSDLYVNPYVYDFDTDRYRAWNDGWEDADIEIRIDDENDGTQLV